MLTRERQLFILVTIFLCLVGLGIYANGLHSGFQFDDYKIIVENPALRHLEDIPFLWRFDPTRFLPHFTFALNYQFGRLHVVSYHVVNVVLHIVCAIFVFCFLKALCQSPSMTDRFTDFQRNLLCLFSTLIFLVHPLQTESVTYIVQRSTVMVALFYVGGALCYTLYRIYNKKFYFVLTFGAALLGSITKPNIITFPLILLLIEYCFLDGEKRSFVKNLFYISPFCIVWVLVPIFLLLWRVGEVDLTKILTVTWETDEISRYQYLITQFNVVMTYILLLICPLYQNLDYDLPLASGFFGFPTFLSFILIVHILYFAFKSYLNQRLFTFGILWFFITLLPESSIFPISDFIFEHRVYLPMVGYTVFASTFLMIFLRDIKKYALVLLCVILTLSVLTIRRNDIWANPERLLKDTIAKSPRKARPVNNLGDFYLRMGKLRLAEEEIKKSIQLAPSNPQNYYNLGVIFERQGRLDDAVNTYSRAITLNPLKSAPASCYYNLGNIYHTRGDLAQAEWLYKKSIELDPTLAEVYGNLGNLYTKQGKYDEAILLYTTSLAINPYQLNSLNGLASVYGMKQDYAKAIETYERLIKLEPRLSLAYNNLGNVYVLRKDLSTAESIFRKALGINAKDAEAHRNLANVYYGLNRFEDATHHMEVAVRLFKEEGKTDLAKELEGRYLNLPRQKESSR